MKISKSFGLFILVMVSCLGCRSGRLIATHQVVTQDTTLIKAIDVVPYHAVSQLKLPVGGDIHLPDLGLKVTRINENTAKVERSQALIERTRTEVKTIAVKQKTVDKSIRGSTVGSKVKDKSQTDSNNKAKKAGNTKAKTNNKQVKRGGFKWWMLPLLALVVFVGYRLKKQFSK